MMNIKTCLNVFLLMLLVGMGGNTVFAQTGKTFVGFCDGKIASASNGTIIGLTGSNVAITEAIRLPHEVLEKYTGMKLTGINAGMPDTPKLPDNIKVWIRKSKDGENIAMGTTRSISSGWNEVLLSAPYTITGEEEELWVGFEFIQQKKLSIISFAGKTDSNGCWLGKNGSFTDYSGKNYGSLAVEAVIEGSEIVSRDLAILSAHAKKSLIHLDQNATIYATIANNASEEASEPVVVCKLNEKQVCKYVLDGTLKQREQRTIELDVPATALDEALGEVSKEGTIFLKLELQWGDKSSDQRPEDNVCSISVTRSETFFPRRLVIEEGTGAWCGWCVLGIVGMRHMSETYPNNFIGIAVHNGDEYAVNNYTSWLTKFFDGYPNCIANRSGQTFSPSAGNLEACMNSLDKESDCDIRLKAQLVDGSILFHTTTTFLSEQQQNDYRMAFVICEDQLPITQHNYYAGGQNGEMGGFENLPKDADIKVDDVARGIYPSPEGLENVFPQSIKRLKVYENDYTIKPPSHIDANHLWAAVLLIDGTTGEIVQACKSKVFSSDGIGEITKSNSFTREGIYNFQGQRMSTLRKGLNIVNGKKVLKR